MCVFGLFLNKCDNLPSVLFSFANLRVSFVLLVCKSSRFSFFIASLYDVLGRIIFRHSFWHLSKDLLFLVVRPPSQTWQDPSRHGRERYFKVKAIVKSIIFPKKLSRKLSSQLCDQKNSSRQLSSPFFFQKLCQGNCQVNCVTKKILQGNCQLNY